MKEFATCSRPRTWATQAEVSQREITSSSLVLPDEFVFGEPLDSAASARASRKAYQAGAGDSA
jgi:hypothetical protein